MVKHMTEREYKSQFRMQFNAKNENQWKFIMYTLITVDYIVHGKYIIGRFTAHFNLHFL